VVGRYFKALELLQYFTSKDLNMTKRRPYWAVVTSLLFTGLLLASATLISTRAQAAPPQQFPILDSVANKVVLKYQNSTCEQLWIQKSQKKPPSADEVKLIQLLKDDAQMRAEFINKIAPPIVNKMFECGMIP
jgi:hypothetical protein